MTQPGVKGERGNQGYPGRKINYYELFRIFIWDFLGSAGLPGTGGFPGQKGYPGQVGLAGRPGKFNRSKERFQQ